MVLVNSVVLVRGDLGLGETAVAIAMGAFGAGSMLAALILPRLLDRVDDRPVMLSGAVLLVTVLGMLAVLVAGVGASWPLLLAAWFAIGLGYSAVLTPSGRLLRRSSHTEDRPAFFAAQFALSHACWLVTYPLAGAVMTASGALVACLVLGALGAVGLVAALRFWPAGDPREVAHRHDDLPPDHPHLRDGAHHAHPYVIDRLHPSWPTR